MKAVTSFFIVMAISCVSMASSFQDVSIPLQVGSKTLVVNAVLRGDGTIMASRNSDAVKRHPLIATSADGRTSAAITANDTSVGIILCQELGFSSSDDRVINTLDRLSSKLATNIIGFDSATRTLDIGDRGGYYLSMVRCSR